jgi:hypothetical protein
MTNFISGKSEFMNTQNSNEGEDKKQGHSHVKHMWMMAICCGLPIIGFLVIGVIGISMPSIETLLLLICPIGMVGMMYMMHRDSQQKEKGSACCESKKSVEETVDGNAHQVTNDTEQDIAKSKQPGSLDA